MNRGVGECVDPEGNGVAMGRGAEGDLAHPVGSKISSWSTTVEETRRQWGNQEDNQDIKNSSYTEFVILWNGDCCSVVNSYNKCVNVIQCLILIALFQKNKSYGSKKPFAFILWCTQESRRAQFQIPPPPQQSTETAGWSFKGHKKIKEGH